MSSTDPGLFAESLSELLRIRAERTPDAVAFGFLGADNAEEGSRTYADLDREARTLAVAILQHAEPGDRALMLYAPGLAFVSAFFACQYAGVVPVPAYPPRPDRLAQSWETLTNIADNCRPRLVLSDSVVAPFVPTQLGPLAGVPHVVTDRLPTDVTTAVETPFDPDGLALLQYTSGSTASPKGVMVSHRNVMHNQRMILEGCDHGRYVGVGVCWLPPYHDLGLIGGLLQTVYRGATTWLMSPLSILYDPFRWLEAVSRYRADTSGGPNFAYDFCVQRITDEQKATLDLSSWSIAGVGSEPIRAESLVRFAEAFAGCGFRREAFYPCYGMAEATLMITGGTRTAPPVIRPGPEPLVGCGRPWLGQEVVVVDPESGVRRPDGEVGEIWVRGPSVALGYWDNSEETERTFRAYRTDTGAGPYLRTGDHGFIEDGELFVTGRLKDLIVIRGRNHHPQDIEATVQAVSANLRRDCGAAFETPVRDQPRVVVVQEVDRRCRTLDEAHLLGDARQAVAERHDLQLHELVLLEPGTIPKTSSGKVRRRQCRTNYENGTLSRWKSRPAPPSRSNPGSSPGSAN